MRISIACILLVGLVGLMMSYPWGGVFAAQPGLSKPGSVIMPNAKPESLRKATFAAGCFWGVEEAFRRVPGVVATEVGYAGGTTQNPNYQSVRTGRTGHAECVQVTYDFTQVSYAELLDAFWSCHDPTQLNRQGPDVGTQYRGAIYVHDAQQEATARASLKEVEEAKLFDRKIVTQISALAAFTTAEEYHQQYLAKNGGVCHTGPVKVETQLAKAARADRLKSAETQPGKS